MVAYTVNNNGFARRRNREKLSPPPRSLYVTNSQGNRMSSAVRALIDVMNGDTTTRSSSSRATLQVGHDERANISGHLRHGWATNPGLTTVTVGGEVLDAGFAGRAGLLPRSRSDQRDAHHRRLKAKVRSR
jgi:hypothetical protein